MKDSLIFFARRAAAFLLPHHSYRRWQVKKAFQAYGSFLKPAWFLLLSCDLLFQARNLKTRKS